jgi:ribosomal protein L24
MRKTFILSALFILFGVTGVWAQSADVGIKPNYAGGEVMSVAENKIILQTKDGTIEIALSDKTEYKRVPPDNPSLKAAVAASFADVGVGDKLLVTGMVSADKKTIPAKAIYLLTKSDIAQRQVKEREEWKTRGISGQVKAINPQTKEITVLVRGIVGSRDVTVTPKDNAILVRYAPDSSNYYEAKPNTFNDIKTGDSIRALGDKNADGTTFSAEKIVTGAFQTIAGTITAINAEKNEIIINNIQTKKDVTIVVGKNTVLKQFPAEMAQRMAQMQMMQAVGTQPGQGSLRPPPGNRQGGQTQRQTLPNQAGQGGGMRSGSLDDLLERFPNITAADLKVGDMIAISSTRSSNQERFTAIKLLSGVEPFLKMPQFPQGNGRRGGQDSGFSIPGLDGGNFP